jgi:hypothetical protein
MEINGLEQIHAEAEEIIQAEVTEKFTAEQLNDFFFLLGGLNAAHSIATNLTSAVINQLQRIRDERLYLAAGYPRFDAFLDEHPKSPMPYKRFNYVEGIYQKLSPAGFDLLKGSGLSMRQMKMLEAGDVQIDGNEVIIGGEERVSLGNSRVVHDLVEKLIEDRNEAKAETTKLQKQKEKADTVIEQGRVELETKQRELDALNGEDPMAAAVAYTFSAFNNLIDGLKESDDEAKKKFAEAYMPAFGNIWFRLSDAAGVPSHLYSKEGQELQQKVAAMKPVEEMTDEEKRATRPERAIAAMVADGSFDDLD